jgi:hypothetical protein
MFGLVFIPAAILIAVAGSQASSPSLTVSPQAVDMGKVQVGGWKERSFSLTNTGAVALAVARLETSCACLKVELPKALIEPGETVTGNIRIDTRTLPVSPGHFALEASGFTESRTGVAFTIRVEVAIVKEE